MSSWIIQNRACCCYFFSRIFSFFFLVFYSLRYQNWLKLHNSIVWCYEVWVGFDMYLFSYLCNPIELHWKRSKFIMCCSRESSLSISTFCLQLLLEKLEMHARALKRAYQQLQLRARIQANTPVHACTYLLTHSITYTRTHALACKLQTKARQAHAHTCISCALASNCHLSSPRSFSKLWASDSHTSKSSTTIEMS